MFTGDSSGDFLYRMLFEKGLASQPGSTSRSDGLVLNRVFISAVCRCAPPGNKPAPEEIKNCLPFLEREMDLLTTLRVYVALGKVAFDQVQKILKKRFPDWRLTDFSHGVTSSSADGLFTLIASYHPSRQNTQTGRLTTEMFSQIGDRILTAIKK
jgi:uracil-DNA glycosylase family 4